MDLVIVTQVLGNIGEFLGSIAVFVTLVYLSVQVKHSKQATEANTRIAQQNHDLALVQNQVARVDLIAQQVRSVALSGELAEIIDKYEHEGIGGLSSAEHRRFHMWHIAQHYILDSQHFQYTLGLLDEESWQDAERRIGAQLDVWDQLDMAIVGREAFVEAVARIRAARLAQ